MRVIEKLTDNILSNSETLFGLTSILAILGTVVVLSGGIWDATSHILREPELFWTIQHISVYTGVGMTASAGIVGSFFILKKAVDISLKRSIQIIIAGSLLQTIAGFGDSISHEIFGIDGLVSLTHQPLELGLVLSALGGFLIIKSHPNNKYNKLLPFSIITLIMSSSWLAFNLLLLVGSTIMCIPIYEIFSSGCAIL